jgi:hypothetical protein
MDTHFYFIIVYKSNYIIHTGLVILFVNLYS